MIHVLPIFALFFFFSKSRVIKLMLFVIIIFLSSEIWSSSMSKLLFKRFWILDIKINGHCSSGFWFYIRITSSRMEAVSISSICDIFVKVERWKMVYSRAKLKLLGISRLRRGSHIWGFKIVCQGDMIRRAIRLATFELKRQFWVDAIQLVRWIFHLFGERRLYFCFPIIFFRDHPGNFWGSWIGKCNLVLDWFQCILYRH